MAEWVQVAQLTDLADAVGMRVDVAGHRVALFRIEDDVYAVGDRCTHAEASLAEGEVFDLEVECPRHGSGFDLRSGKPGALPATRPVDVYEVRVEGGAVSLLLEPIEEDE